MSEEKILMRMDTDPQIARMILDVAEYLTKAPPKEWNSIGPGDEPPKPHYFQRMTDEHVKEAANLVFLAMSLIAEKKQ